MGRFGLFHRFQQPHERLFVEREYAALLGRRGRVFLLLLSIVLCTFLAVVLAHSGKEHLRARMDDPFSSLICITASSVKHAENYAVIQDFLDNCAEKNEFGVGKVSGAYIDGWHFHGRTRLVYASVMSFGYWKDQDMLKRILQLDNVVDTLDGKALSGGPDAFSNGIVISREFAEVLGYSVADLMKKDVLMVSGGHTIRLHVLAVVETLPEKSWGLVEHRLSHSIRDAGTTVFPYHRDDPTMEIWVNEEKVELVRDELKKQLDSIMHEPVSITIEAEDGILTHPKKLVVTRDSANWRTDIKADYQMSLNAAGSTFRAYRPAVKFDVSLRPPDSSSVYGQAQPPVRRFDLLTITFDPVDGVEAFQRAIREHTTPSAEEYDSEEARYKAPVELDLSRVEAQKNFGVVVGLGGMLLIALILFAMLSVLLYLYNLLRSHLDRMKMNLGTFMAFGLSPDLIRAGYLRIVLLLLLRVIGLAVAILVAAQAILWGLERLGGRVPPVLANMSVLTDPWLYLSAAAILVSSLFICNGLLTKFLAAPPGDLIYDRQ